MPLTPADVASKQFRVTLRGYAFGEVDAFLDEVESELTRLLRERAEPAVLPAAAPRALDVGEAQQAALRTLLLAQRTADEAVAEARREAQQLVATARVEAEATLTAAREQAAATLADAEREAAQAVADSAERAARLDEEIALRLEAALGDLDARRQQLEDQLTQLQAFEREYRTRLRAYLEGQLRELGGASGSDDGAAAPGSTTSGRPAGGAVRIGGPAKLAPAASLRAVPAADDGADPAPAAPTAEH